MMVALRVSVAGRAAIGPRNMGIDTSQAGMTAYGQLVRNPEAWNTAVCIEHLNTRIQDYYITLQQRRAV
jgi:hypothetical protein